MRTIAQKKEILPDITIDPNMRDYSKDPFIIKKNERARAFIAKHGLPKDIPAPNAPKTKPKKKQSKPAN